MHLTLAMTASHRDPLPFSSSLCDVASNNDKARVTKGRNVLKVIFAGRRIGGWRTLSSSHLGLLLAIPRCVLDDGDEYARLKFPESVKRKGQTATANAL